MNLNKLSTQALLELLFTSLSFNEHDIDIIPEKITNEEIAEIDFFVQQENKEIEKFDVREYLIRKLKAMGFDEDTIT